MGYYVSKLKNIPCNLEWYFFLVGNYQIHNVINDLFRNDFEIIARSLGSDAGIIAQSNALEEELKDYVRYGCAGDLSDILLNLQDDTPGMLILNKHPHDFDLEDEETHKKGVIIYIPFEVLGKAYSDTNILLGDIISFAKNENKNLLKKTSKVGKKKRGHNKFDYSLGINMGIITINIGIK